MTPMRPQEEVSNPLRMLPSVHELLQNELIQQAAERFGKLPTREVTRNVLNLLRNELSQGTLDNVSEAILELPARIVADLENRQQQRLRKVLNATGILLHTGLGRAPLAEEAVQAVIQATGYCNVEIDLLKGDRTQRSSSVEADLCALTGAEAAHVVNNNAGATGLALAALATGKEVIVSQGELIEIGGGFRLPEVFQAFGAKLRAVGTTNRTRPEDFEQAINGETGALMQVHSSNYRIVGFEEHPSLNQLVEIGASQNIPVIHDIGSGAVVETPDAVTSSDPLARESIHQGADIVLFSGDKLMGGPQCGIIVGKKEHVRRLVSHPMSRALRIDKLTLAALQATLAIYRRAELNPQLLHVVPFLRMLQTPAVQIHKRAEKLAARVAEERLPWQVEVLKTVSFAGGGSLPGHELASYALGVTHPEYDAEALAYQLRTGHPAVVGRVHEGVLLLDLRCIDASEDGVLLSTLAQLERSL